MSNLTKYETETYVNFNDEEKEARLCTFNRSWIRRMSKLCLEYPEFHCVRQTEDYGEYTFPKKYFKVRNPRKKATSKGNIDMPEDSNDE